MQKFFGLGALLCLSGCGSLSTNDQIIHTKHSNVSENKKIILKTHNTNSKDVGDDFETICNSSDKNKAESPFQIYDSCDGIEISSSKKHSSNHGVTFSRLVRPEEMTPAERRIQGLREFGF
jgi:hypothetical protein